MWHLTRTPIPHDPDRGEEALAALPGLPPDLAGLIRGTAGSSPYLGGLILREAEWLAGALAARPDDSLAAILAEARALEAAEISPGLRRLKRRIALLSGLADLGGVWTLEQVTGALSDFAGLAVDRALKASIAPLARRGRIPGLSEEQAWEDAGGVFVIAMGKMGAGELNYSSDIDLIVLFDETRYDAGDFQEARAGFIKATRAMTQALSEQTGEGYVFRTDLRLRPDPSVTPVCFAMDAAERYYESVGRTWERAAYIKASICAGDIAAGQGFLKRLTPFVWRKHLDFAAIEDAHDMRLKIREHKGLGGPVALLGHDMKLGRGGIREIEFFTQTRQLIAGGRDPSLRLRGTVEGLAALTASGWVGAEVTQELTIAYRAHREVDHRVQMVNDAQTHALPSSEEGFARVAHLMGRGDITALKVELQDRLARVHHLTEGFFAPGQEERVTDPRHDALIARWMRFPSLRSERARERFRRLRPMLLDRLSAAAHPEEAIASFEEFLRGQPAGVQLFALFEANPQLVDLIVDIASTAPALARYLARNASVLDAVIGGDFFADWPGEPGLTAALGRLLAGTRDYEGRLDAARRWMKEWHFRIGVHALRGLIDAEAAGAQYADLAQACLRGLWPHVVAEFAAKHGAPPGRGATVLGMGSLGSGRLNAGSDLDLIVIYDADGVEASEGRRPLASRAYYARLTQALVTALSAPMAEGKLYDVDMRLRPSGRQGPVATSFASFRSYQRDEAWGWEHMALTRARAVAGSEALAEDIETFRRAVLEEVGRPDKARKDAGEMWARLAEAAPARGLWDVKAGPGGLRSLELFAQGAALGAGVAARSPRAQLGAAEELGWITEAELEELCAAEALLWRIVAAERLLLDGAFSPKAVGAGGQAFLLRATGEPGLDELEARLQGVLTRTAAILAAALEVQDG